MAFTLVVSKPDGSSEEFPLDGELTIGRESGNGVVLRDLSVSRRHARFAVDEGKVVVEDLGSSNGVLVNGAPIDAPTVVADGAEVLIGDFVVRIEGGGNGAGAAKKPARRGAPAPSDDMDGKITGSIPGRKSKLAQPRSARGAGAPSPARGGASGAPARNARGGPGGRAPGAATRLRGVNGPWAGQVYALDKPAVVVGRVAPADIVVDDDSVSRRHAELRRSGPGYTVRDLGSSNGSFIGEDPIGGERPLRPGDHVKFGVVEFVYEGPAATKQAADTPAQRRRKILIGAVGGVTFLVVLGLILKPKKAPPAPPPDTQEQKDQDVDLEARKEKIFDLMRMGKSYMEEGQWDQAVSNFKQVEDLDPVNGEARAKRKLAEREQEMKRWYEDAKKKADLGQDEPAMALFMHIAQESWYFKRARVDVKAVAERLAKVKDSDCRAFLHARNFEQAVKSCGRYMDLTCYGKPDPDLKADLKVAEEQYKKSHHDYRAWSCPVDLAPWLTEKEQVATVNVRDAISQRYGDSEIVDALMLYVEGNRAQEAIERLRKVRQNPAKAKFHQTADLLDSSLRLISGKFTDGNSYYLSGNVERAEQEWKPALEEDERIVPSPAHSALNTQVRTALAEGYASLGKKLFDQQRYADAYARYAKGLEYNNSNTKVLDGIQRLEQQAKAAIDAAQSCADIQQILKYTRGGDNASPAHKQAADLADQNHCNN